jgi:uncharacterized RDD family membrane protein YckC
MTTGQTRFFCRCGRLLTVAATIREVTCPTCRERSVVPHLGAPPPPPPVAATSPAAASRGAATAALGPQASQRIGRFELVATLGQGGMGSVWRARDRHSGTDVALKVLHPGLQARPDFLSRFEREARAAAALRHRNIVQVIDSGVDDGTPWIAMELVEGEDLLAAAQRGTLRPDNVVAIALQAAHGLLAAAGQGFTHRDVKPGNILLTAEGVVKVADFGLAKAVDSQSRVTVTGEILGTPHYMAPEQGRGERVDHRADLYALGATLYHVLCGAPPHEAETPVAVIMKHLRDEPLPLRTRNPAVPVSIERIVHRLLQKDPEQRYQTHAALIADLMRVAEGKEPLGGAEPPLRRVQHGDTTYMLAHEATTEFVLAPAGAIRRLLAFLVDLLAVEVLARVVVAAGCALFATVGGRSFVDRLLRPDLPQDDDATHGIALAALAIAWLHFVAADSRGGRTIGRQWFSLRLCRRDGGDLGLLRAAFRALLLLPAVASMVPALAESVLRLLGALGFPAAPDRRELLFSGILLWIAVELVGRMTALRRSLIDGLAGAYCYLAQQPRAVLRGTAPGTTPPTDFGRVLRWSIIPGGGLVCVGRPILGLLCFTLTVWQLAVSDPDIGAGIWLIAAVIAIRIARSRRSAATAPGPTAVLAPPTPTIRRQES